MRVKREETKGELESKLNFVDAEERKYRLKIDYYVPRTFIKRTQTHQQTSDITFI